MKKMLALLLLCLSAHVSADTFATQPNNAGGKIVLTDELCKDTNGKIYEKLNRAYNYGSTGYTSEGCWYIEDETIVVVWLETNSRMRYPVANFTLNPKWKNKSKGYTH